MVAAGMGLLAGPGASPPAPGTSATEARADRSVQSMFGGSGVVDPRIAAAFNRSGYAAPSHLRVHPPTGWTNRRYQRAALKRRNRITNRRNHRA
jgi:hypothetical protein